MKNTIILWSLFLVFLSSCNCTETNLTKEEREWFSVYDKGQTIIFKSNLGNLDTLLVSEKIETHNNKDCNYFGIGSMQPNVMFIRIKSKICHNESYCGGEIFISKDKVDEKCFPSFTLFGLNQEGQLSKVVSKLESNGLDTIKKIYNHVYNFEDGINAKSYGSNYLKSFYWDKKEGLVRYDLVNGEIFELFKKYK